MNTFLTSHIGSDLSGSDNAPDKILLFAAGWNELERDGKYFVDYQAYQLVLAQFLRRGLDLVFDYEHQTLSGNQAPAAGWITDLKWEEDKGVIAKVTWTEKAAQYIASKEYRYFSPVFFVRKSDLRLYSLESAALTNQPKHNHLQPILAKHSGNGPQGEIMDLKKLIAALKMSETATEEEVLAKIASMQEPQVTEVLPAEVLTALDMQEGDKSAVVASIHALKQTDKTKVSRAEFDALQAQLKQRDALEVVASAKAEGKITPDQQEWAMTYAQADLEGFKSFVAKAPVVIPVDSLPGKDRQQAPATHENEAVLAVAKQMDVDPEDIKKFGGE